MQHLDQNVSIQAARQAVSAGQIIAYPTEAVYGLGCDPFQEKAVHGLLQLKHRDVAQGLILLIADWEQLYPLIDPVPEACMAKVKHTWPGHVTWVFPKSQMIPAWVSGQHEGIAIRMTAHPIARALCAAQPLISTSANQHGQSPVRSIEALHAMFPEGIDMFVAGALGQAEQPSAMYDVLSGRCLRY